MSLDGVTAAGDWRPDRRVCDACASTTAYTLNLPPGWESLNALDLCPECVTILVERASRAA